MQRIAFCMPGKEFCLCIKFPPPSLLLFLLKHLVVMSLGCLIKFSWQSIVCTKATGSEWCSLQGTLDSSATWHCQSPCPAPFSLRGLLLPESRCFWGVSKCLTGVMLSRLLALPWLPFPPIAFPGLSSLAGPELQVVFFFFISLDC